MGQQSSYDQDAHDENNDRASTPPTIITINNNNNQQRPLTTRRTNRHHQQQDASRSSSSSSYSHPYFLMFGGPTVEPNYMDPLILLQQMRTFDPTNNNMNIFGVTTATSQQQQHLEQQRNMPEFRPTETLKNDMNCLKRSVKLIPLLQWEQQQQYHHHHDNDVDDATRKVPTTTTTNMIDYHSETRYVLQFELDTSVQCDVIVHWNAVERRDAKFDFLKIRSLQQHQQQVVDNHHSSTLRMQRFNPGTSQIYQSPIDGLIDFSNVSEEDLHYDDRVDPFKYPLIIEVRSTFNNNNNSRSEEENDGNEDHCLTVSEKASKLSYQFTYATITQNSDGLYSVKVLKQKNSSGWKGV